MFLALVMALVGLHWMFTALLVKRATFLADFDHERVPSSWLLFFSFERGLLFSCLFTSAALGLFVYILLTWRQTGVITNLEMKQALLSLYLFNNASLIFLFSIIGHLILMRSTKV